MKFAAIVLCGLALPLTVSAQDVHSSPCDTIAKLDARVGRYRQYLAQLRLKYTDKHPDVIAQKEVVARAEADRDAAVAQAASEGVVCSGSESSQSAPAPQAERQSAPPNLR